jgi:hypothetical protein
MPKEFRVEEWEEVIVNGESRDFEIDEDARVVRVRRDLPPRRMYAAGYAHGRAVSRQLIPVLRDAFHEPDPR